MFAAAVAVVLIADPAPDLKKQLDAISKKLNGRVKANVLAGLEEAGELGKDAMPLFRKICELVLGRNEEIAGAAADALEKISPKHHDAVLKLRKMGDEDFDKQVFELIGGLGEDGLPLAWVVHERMARTAARFKMIGGQRSPLGELGFKTLRGIGDTSETHWQLALVYNATFANEPGRDSYNHFIKTDRTKRVAHVKRMIATFNTYSLEQLDLIAGVGKDGKDALPKLKRMVKLHPDKKVREAAAEVIDVIEAALKKGD